MPKYKTYIGGVVDFMEWAQTHEVLLDSGYQWVASKCLNDSIRAYFDVSDDTVAQINEYIKHNLYYFDLLEVKDFYIIDDCAFSSAYATASREIGYIAKMKRKYGGSRK